MKQKQTGIVGYMILIYLVLLAVGGVGWVMNIVEIVHSDFGHIGGLLVVRIIGVFVPPLGAVLGYF